ncbi:MAG TPA: phage minor head protein, partial [Geobacterales bacterium]|nr:phage minor head protein [Geobacterales bacterium]
AKIAARGEDGTFTAKRLAALLAELRDINTEAYRQAENIVKAEMALFAVQEADILAGVIEKSFPRSITLDMVTPTPEQLAAIATSKPFQGGLLSEWFGGLAEAKQTVVRQAIRLGMTEGETIDQMVRRLAGTRANRYTDGALEITRKNAEAVVRTAVNHTSNQAQQMLFAFNEELVKGWTFLATLDSRTTITCASLSGSEWPTGEGPIPPRHVRCRSFALPRLATFRDLGIDIEEFPAGQRASMGGPVSAELSFTDWLKGQGADTQKNILGARRAELFREGGLSVDKFTDRKGVVYTLDELRKKQSEAFARVFN